MVLRLAANSLVSALLAPSCALCNEILETPLDGCVCINCWKTVKPITPPICDMCGDPWADSRVCSSCIAHPRVIRRTRAIGEYDGTLREAIHALKYEHRYSVAAPLAALMWACGRGVLYDADCVVPVPLHRKRERQRGFNQARELARWLGPPMIDALIRVRHTSSQVDLPADRRRANVQNAFAIRAARFGRAPVVDGLRVVLVDDVSTTGSTLESCAAVLLAAGAKDVSALTAARVVTERR
jgi:ComF family protein